MLNDRLFAYKVKVDEAFDELSKVKHNQFCEAVNS
jgi:hypothetical protein